MIQSALRPAMVQTAQDPSLVRREPATQLPALRGRFLVGLHVVNRAEEAPRHGQFLAPEMDPWFRKRNVQLMVQEQNHQRRALATPTHAPLLQLGMQETGVLAVLRVDQALRLARSSVCKARSPSTITSAQEASRQLRKLALPLLVPHGRKDHGDLAALIVGPQVFRLAR